MYSIMGSNDSLLKRLIDRMAADVEVAAAGTLLLSDEAMSDFKADCAMLTFIGEKEN